MHFDVTKYNSIQLSSIVVTPSKNYQIFVSPEKFIKSKIQGFDSRATVYSLTSFLVTISYSKTCLKQPLKRTPKIGFQYRLSLNAGQKYCRMLQREHSAIL